MPLLPGFEGDVGGATGNALRAITHWNYSSISRGKDSLIHRLMSAGVKNPGDYISFHSLRTHAVLCGVPCTELIYVHSKLMIVDDRTVICGSANINDRSMIGTRDSEIACIIHDEAFIDGKMNGESYPCGVFAGALRKKLFKEHLGLLGGVKLKGIKKVKKNGIQLNTSARSSVEISESNKVEKVEDVPKTVEVQNEQTSITPKESLESSTDEITNDQDTAGSVASDNTKLSDSVPTTPLQTNSAIDITDPTISSFWFDTWCKISYTNTKIFDEVFRCIPTDNVQTIAQMKKYGEEPFVAMYKVDVPKAMEMLEEIQGNLVDLPLEFLVKEVLTPPVNSKEGIMPTSLWT